MARQGGLLLLPDELEGRLVARLAEKGRDLPGLVESEPILAGGFLEERESGERFAVDVLRLEDGEHLFGEPPDIGRPVLAEVEDRQIEGDGGGVIAVAQGDEAGARCEIGLFGGREIPWPAAMSPRSQSSRS